MRIYEGKKGELLYTLSRDWLDSKRNIYALMLSDTGNLVVGKGTNLSNMQAVDKRVVNGLSGEALSVQESMLRSPDATFTFVENGGDIVVFPLLKAEAGPEQVKNHKLDLAGLQFHHVVPDNARVENLGVHSGFKLIRLSPEQ